MPNRILYASLIKSRKYNAVGPAERDLYTRLILLADDFGRYDGNPVIVAREAYPVIETIKSGDIEPLLNNLESVGLIVIYSVNGEKYIQITNWNQRTRARVSKYPEPPKGITAPRENDLPMESDIEDLLVASLSKMDEFNGEKIISIDRQVRVQESYLDVVVKTAKQTYFFEIKRGRLSNKAIDQVIKYQEMVDGKALLVGCGLSANFDLGKCMDKEIAVITYTEKDFDTSIANRPGWLIKTSREITLNHVMKCLPLDGDGDGDGDGGGDDARAREVPPPVTDESFKKIHDAWTSCGYGIMSPATAEVMASYLEDMELPVILYAIEQGDLNAKRTLGYVKAILKRCLDEGIKTGTQLEATEKARTASKARDAPGIHFENERKYTEEELEQYFVDFGGSYESCN